MAQAKTKFNAHTRIINALGRNGPMTGRQLNEHLGITSSQTRIYEINKHYKGLEIKKDYHGGRYYISVVRNITIDPKRVYPNHNTYGKKK